MGWARQEIRDLVACRGRLLRGQWVPMDLPALWGMQVLLVPQDDMESQALRDTLAFPELWAGQALAELTVYRVQQASLVLLASRGALGTMGRLATLVLPVVLVSWVWRVSRAILAWRACMVLWVLLVKALSMELLVCLVPLVLLDLLVRREVRGRPVLLEGLALWVQTGLMVHKVCLVCQPCTAIGKTSGVPAPSCHTSNRQRTLARCGIGFKKGRRACLSVYLCVFYRQSSGGRKYLL